MDITADDVYNISTFILFASCYITAFLFYTGKANMLKHLYMIDSSYLDIKNWVKFRLQAMSVCQRDFQQLCALLNPLCDMGNLLMLTASALFYFLFFLHDAEIRYSSKMCV